MAEFKLNKMYELFRRPRIIWDPVPWWVRLNKRQIKQFNEVQVELNTKLAELEALKMKELAKIAGIQMK